jgi:O-antigen ligase
MDMEPRKRAQNPILGILFMVSLLLFGGTFSWLTSSQSLPLLQLPLLLISFALAASTGFMYFLNPARALTFALLGMLYFSFEFTARASEGAGSDSQTILKGALAMAFAIFALFTSPRYAFRSGLTGVYIVYSLFAVCTAFYSPAPIFGLVAGLALVGLTLVAARLSQGKQEDLLALWNAIFWASCLTCILSLALMAISPMQARDLSDMRYRLRGVTGTANALGPLMAVGFIAALLRLKTITGRWTRYFTVLMAASFLITLGLTYSRTSIVGLIAGLIGAALVSGVIGTLGFMFVLLALAIIGGALLNPDINNMILQSLADLFAKTGEVAELTSLTGRGVIWEACWKLFTERPTFGYGLGSVRVVLPLAYSDQWGNVYGTAHNFLLESLISVGVVGTLPLVAVLLLGLIKLLDYFRSLQKHRKAKRLTTAEEQATSVEQQLALCSIRGLLTLIVLGISEKSFAGQPGSTTMALGAILATTVYVSNARKKREALLASSTKAEFTRL